MDISNKNRVFITIFLSGCAFLISYLIDFALTPYIIKNIGAEANGFVSLAKTFVSYAAIITTALNSYASRYISIAYHKNDLKMALQYFSSVFYADVILALIISILAGFIIFFLPYLFNISSELIQDVKLLFVFVFITFFITTVGTVFTAPAYIKDRLDKVNVFKGLSYAVEAVTIIMLFFYGGAKIWFIGVGLLIAGIVVFFGNFYIAKTLTPKLRVDPKNFSFNAVKKLVGSGIWNSINGLGNILNSGIDLTVTNKLLTPLLMGQLSVAKTMGSIFSALYIMIAQPFQPIFLKNYAKGNKVALLKDLKFSIKISGLVSNVAFAIFASVGLSYYQLWIPGQDIKLIYTLTLVTILTSISEGAVYPLYYIYTLTVKNKIPCIITLMGGILNVISMYLLITFTPLGIYSVVFTTAVIMNFINYITNPLYMAKCLKVKWCEFYPTLLRHTISCVIMTIVLTTLSQQWSINSWRSLIVTVILEGIIGTMIHILIMFNKNDIINGFTTIVKKLKFII